jgi:prephenate dehydrogenase
MAGREKMGFDFASDTVFKGANYLITPLPRNKEESLLLVETLAIALGFKRVRRISPETHDMLIAHTSQLPHAMAVALINSDREGRETGQFIGDSYRDLTRIARINGALWSELFLSNKEYLLEAMDDFSAQLGLIKDALLREDKDALIRLFETSTARREKLDS